MGTNNLENQTILQFYFLVAILSRVFKLGLWGDSESQSFPKWHRGAFET